MRPTVDTREQNLELKASFLHAGWEHKALRAGDIGWTLFHLPNKPLVLIERKTTDDLIASIEDGRLVSQARRMAEDAQYPVLLWEGRDAQDAAGRVIGHERWQREAIWGELQTVQDMGLRIQRTTDVQDTVKRVWYLYEKYYKKAFHPSVHRQAAEDARVAALCLIYGVGEKTALDILKTHPTLRTLDEAVYYNPTNIGVKGVGSVLCKRLWEFFNGDGTSLEHSESKQSV